MVYFFFFFYGLIMGAICVVCQRHSFLGVLLSLEVFSLVLYCLFFVVWGEMREVWGFGLVFLCMSVCVVCVSLGLVVKLVRSAGSDYVSSFSL
uniref:NADH-ubiquinone oxidoreductase chain 4L n=1 Tax=Cumberlandia monodonta TaxID=52365 RepID=A0A1X9JIB5_CUMMO|nr:NADH dehydrogenase subunit 4L [Cumberlandia monodonta]